MEPQGGSVRGGWDVGAHQWFWHMRCPPSMTFSPSPAEPLWGSGGPMHFRFRCPRKIRRENVSNAALLQ